MNAASRQCLLLFGLVLLLPCSTWAQRSDDGAVTGESLGAQARYEAVRRMLQAPPAPEDVAAVTALAHTGCLHALNSLVPSKADAYEKAFEEYRGMLLDTPDALVKLAAEEPVTSARVSLSVRRLAAQQIAQLPPSLVAEHRRAVEPEARRLLHEGREQRRADLLLRVTRDYALSDSALPAFELLGDLAFEQGDFSLALHWWRQYESRAQTRDEPIDGTRVAAKQVLALAFDGDLSSARRALSAFRVRHPDARGSLAGTTGRYADILARWLALREKHADDALVEPWTTFAGAACGHRSLAEALPAALWMDGPTWRVPLPRHDPKAPHPAERFLLQRHAPCHPIITEGQVLVADARSVTSFDLDTGKQIFQHRLVLGAKEETHERRPFGQRPRHTLSAGQGRVFARLGRQGIGPGDRDEPDDQRLAAVPSVLVCLDVATRPIPEGGRVLWQVNARSPDGEPAFFEGAPLVGDDRVWILVSEFNGATTRFYLACYDFHGAMRWMRELCELPEFIEGRSDRARHHLLSRSGTNIVAVTHAGAVIAVDAASGVPVWAVRYPRLGSERDRIPRELLPALTCPGRVVAAPADSNLVMCLDAETGRVLWERDHLHATHLLAATHDILLLALPFGATALDLTTGETRWQQPAAGKLPSLGRGLLAGEWYLWPTHDPQLPFRAVHVREGTPFVHENAGYEPTQLRQLPAGNVVFGQDSLVIATPNEIVTFVGPRRRLAKLQTEAAAPGATAADHYRLRLARRLLGEKDDAPLKEPWRTLLDSRLSAPVAPPSSVTRPAPVRGEDAGPGIPSLSTGKLGLLWERPGWLLPVSCAAAEEDAAFSIANGTLVCMDSASGRSRWQARLRHPPVTWLGRRGDSVVAAGPLGLEGFAVADGASRWSMALPESPSFRLERDAPTPEPTLSAFGDFAWRGGYLTFFLDQRQAFVLSAEDGRVLHSQRCRGAEVRALEGPRFQPHIDLVPHGSDLQVRVFETKHTADIVNRADVSRLMSLIASEPGQVAYHERGEAKPRWTFSYPAPSQLDGRIPRLMGKEDVLLAAFRTNLGDDLYRLDPLTGRAIWRLPPGTTPPLDTAAVTEHAIYMVLGGQLAARTVSNGRILWTRPLPEHVRRWHVEVTVGGILAYPLSRAARPCLPAPDLTSVWTLHYVVASPRDFPVLLVDRASGETRWTLHFDSRGGPARVQTQGTRLLVSAGGMSYCLGPEIGNKP
jgi:outer membrane protein assembly factor BamB